MAVVGKSSAPEKYIGGKKICNIFEYNIFKYIFIPPM
jgi:hypothetical protein